MFIDGTFPSEVETMHNEVETMHKEAGELIVSERKLLKNTDCGMIDFDLAATIDVKDIEGHADVLNERREDGETLLESVYPEAVAARERTNKKIVDEVRAEHQKLKADKLRAAELDKLRRRDEEAQRRQSKKAMQGQKTSWQNLKITSQPSIAMRSGAGWGDPKSPDFKNSLSL